MKTDKVYHICQTLFDKWISCNGCKYQFTKEAIHTEYPCFGCIRPIIFRRNDNYKRKKK